MSAKQEIPTAKISMKNRPIPSADIEMISNQLEGGDYH
jgi:hypothetical protein